MNIFPQIIMAAFLLFLPAYSFAATNMPFNELIVQFAPERNKITGVSKISLPAGQSGRVNFSGLKVTAVSIQDRPLFIDPGMASLTFTPGSPSDVLKIEYEAEYGALPEIETTRNPGVIRGNLISSEGIVLTDNWHPSLEGYSYYRLTAILPAEFEGISEADVIEVTERADSSREFLFVFDHPVRNLTLIAGRYQVEKESRGEIDIYTYFFAEDSGIAKTYLEYTKKYLDMYEEYIGRYPFRRFSVVANLLPTGYALPTFTLLGKDVIKMPFIVETSLGHEVLHQWFGNLVYIDYKSGNWAEGLTTYLADHFYEELKGTGWDYRKQMLISYQSHVTEGKDFPLQSFSGRMDKASAAIGYGKSAMVFHMLRKMTGDDIFFSSIRRFVEKNSFKAASWSEIRDAFEYGYGKKLDWFFKQWVDEGGMPEIEIKNLDLKYRGAKAIVSFTVNQKSKNYRIYLPVALKLAGGGEVKKIFEIEGETTSLEVETGIDEMTVALIVDPDYDLFRKLAPEEFPPVISRLLGDDKKIFVLPGGREDEFNGLSEFIRKEGFAEKKEAEVSYDDIKNASLLVPAVETPLVKRLLGRIEKQDADFTFIIKENPLNKNKVIAVIDSPVSQDIMQYMNRTTHYGKYSSLAFKDNKNIKKIISGSERGIRSDIIEDTIGIAVSRTMDMNSIIETVSGKDIIYIGEFHDRFEHHRVQLRVIMELYKKYKNIAIGMEMFQKPFQEAVDDYIEGRTDEKTFLKRSEYFKRWGFDYNLYREILLFAREYRIPVIALNIRKEIVSKVSKEGLHSLTEEELNEVPEYLDLSDMEYRERLKGSFESHSGSKDRNFDFFYQSQVLWDESMAHNLDAFIKKNPAHKVVVLAGAGHMFFGSGVPKHSYKLNKRDYAVILNGGDIKNNIADFVMFPAPVPLPESPRLGVLLKEEDKKVVISRLSAGGIAEKAGLKEGDIVLYLDDAIIESVDDIKIFLFFKNKGDEVSVKVLRERFIFGPAVMEFKATL